MLASPAFRSGNMASKHLTRILKQTSLPARKDLMQEMRHVRKVFVTMDDLMAQHLSADL